MITGTSRMMWGEYARSDGTEEKKTRARHTFNGLQADFLSEQSNVVDGSVGEDAQERIRHAQPGPQDRREPNSWLDGCTFELA